MGEVDAVNRQRPQGRRRGQTYKLKASGITLHVTLNVYPETHKLCEIWVEAGVPGSDLQASYQAWAMMASKAIQFGMHPYDIAKSCRRIKTHTSKLITEDCLAIHGREVLSTWDAIGLLIEAEVNVKKCLTSYEEE